VFHKNNPGAFVAIIRTLFCFWNVGSYYYYHY